MPKDDNDYVYKAAKLTQPVRDAFSPKKVSAAPKPAPKAPEAPKPMVKAGELQGGVSLADDTYIRRAHERATRRLAPKSVMGKSSPKR